MCVIVQYKLPLMSLNSITVNFCISANSFQCPGLMLPYIKITGNTDIMS